MNYNAMNTTSRIIHTAWLIPDRYSNDYQYYRQWATNAWIKAGGKTKKGLQSPFILKQAMGHFNLISRIIPRKAKKNALIVCCGAFPDYSAWPYNYTYEIIPIIWDCWPKYHKRLIRSIINCKINTLFCTSSQIVEMLKTQFPNLNAYWIPEGIEVNAYCEGGELKDRKIDILELGRQLSELHNFLLKYNKDCHITHLYNQGTNLIFKDFSSLTKGLSDAKITVCYPRCDTNPELAGNIETLTQRYWECMLSKTLMVGRAPKELIKFCGYNPVIELQNNSFEKIINILNHITNYQEFVNKNRDFALRNSPWSNRIANIQKILSNLNYEM